MRLDRKASKLPAAGGRIVPESTVNPTWKLIFTLKKV